MDKNIINRKFDRLLVIDFSHKKNHSYFKCKCDCGNIHIARIDSLLKGSTRSCGCLKKERKITDPNWLLQPKSSSKAYETWKQMRHRCMRPLHKQYAAYGGRGIKVCKRWLKFENFFKDMGHPPPNKSLDRINNNKGYKPSNCRWATKSEQNNNKRTNVLITFNNQTLNITQWSKKLGISDSTIGSRIQKGWPLEKCFSRKSYGSIPFGIGGWRNL